MADVVPTKISMAGLMPVQVEYMAARVLWLGTVNMSVRGLREPVPRSFSEKITVLLVPSVMLAILFLLR